MRRKTEKTNGKKIMTEMGASDPTLFQYKKKIYTAYYHGSAVLCKFHLNMSTRRMQFMVSEKTDVKMRMLEMYQHKGQAGLDKFFTAFIQLKINSGTEHGSARLHTVYTRFLKGCFFAFFFSLVGLCGIPDGKGT